MTADLEAALGAVVGDGAEVTWGEVDDAFDGARREAANAVETAL